MVSACLILAFAGLVPAAELTGYSIMPNPDVHAVDGGGFSDSTYALRSCSLGRKSCDDSFCIPLSGQCCSVGIGAYCRAGRHCVPGGCCVAGKTCRGIGTGGGGACSAGEDACGDFCMDKGAECCQPLTGRWCGRGKTCVSGGTRCALGGGSGGSGGGQSSSIIFRGAATTSYLLSPATTDSNSGSSPTADSGSRGSSSGGSSPVSSSSTATARPNASPSHGPILLMALIAAAPLLAL